MVDPSEVHESADFTATRQVHFHKPALKTPGSKVGLWIGLAVLIIPFVVYIQTLCPTVFVGDAGDFLTASFTLGVPHPPGYPLYTMLGHIFMQLPIYPAIDNVSLPAYRMNLLSALCAWGACIFMFLYLRRILRTEWAAIAGALALAFSRQFWQHAEIAEVYTMQVMFMTLIFYLAVLYVQEKKVGWALLLSFIMGLALSHQYAILIFYPGVLIFVCMNGGLRLRIGTWILAVILAIMGLVPYIYLPLVKYKTPNGIVEFVQSQEEANQLPIDVAAVQETPGMYFWNYFSRRLYSQSRVFTHSETALHSRTTTPMVFKRFVEVTVEDYAYPLLIFGLLGWVALAAGLRENGKNKTMFNSGPALPVAGLLMPSLGYIIYFLIIHFYPSGDILAAPLENIKVVIPPLLIPLQAGFAAVIGFGFDWSQRAVARYVGHDSARYLNASPKFKTFSGLLMIAAFAVVAVNAGVNAYFCDKSNSVISYNYAMNVLDSCDPDAILLTTGDETFMFWYLQYCEHSEIPDDPVPGYRRDVWATNWIHNILDLEILANETDAMREVMDNFIINSGYYVPELTNYYGVRPVNSTFIPATFADSENIMALECILNGLTYLFRRPGDIPSLENTDIRGKANLPEEAEGVEPMLVVDYFNPAPFNTYNWNGLPRFEQEITDITQINTDFYQNVYLESQEKEVLGRYQDALYRFGVQALLDDDPAAAELAWKYFFHVVSLDPDDWFGWKELGDAFIGAGQFERAKGAYEQLLVIARATGEVDPNLEAGAMAGIAHVELVIGNLDESREWAEYALLMNPDEMLAKMVIEEIEKKLLEDEQASALDESAPVEEIESDSDDETSDEETENDIEQIPSF